MLSAMPIPGLNPPTVGTSRCVSPVPFLLMAHTHNNVSQKRHPLYASTSNTRQCHTVRGHTMRGYSFGCHTM